ncbi:MAG: hypothetical protein ACTHOO_03745 [Alcanivorax sp.]
MNEEHLGRLRDKLGQSFLSTSDGKRLEGDDRSYTKFGIFNDGQDFKEFITVQMTADDDIEAIRNTPIAELDDDDFVMDKPMKYDFDTNNWQEQKGLINMISNSSFSFVDENAFYDELLEEISDRQKLEGPTGKLDVDGLDAG